MGTVSADWHEAMLEETAKPYYKELSRFVLSEYKRTTVYPPKEMIYSAFEVTPLHEVKVLILGQDPYHEPNQAHGMSFSVLPGQSIPKSLQNIYKELQTDLGCYIPNNGYLMKWARQGVLLLNTVLTVRAHEANSHARHGWETFTDRIISIINEEDRPIVIILWGNSAKAKMSLLNNPKHLVLTSAHPSPLSASRGFFGCRHFSKANDFLASNGIEPIDWQIENI